MKRIIGTWLAFLLAGDVMAQGNVNDSTGLRAGGKIYVVIAVIAVIWAGFGFLLFSMDNRLRKIEKATTKKIR